MISYDPRFMPWEKWCALMAELFAQQQLGTLPEDRWKEWAAGMVGIGYFTESGVPDPRGFSEWRDWATQLCGIISITTPKS